MIDSICTFPLCKQYVKPGSSFCFSHNKHFGTPTMKAAPKKISALSVKRKALQKGYVKIVKDMLKENPNCQIKAFGCTKKAEGLHHIVKRSESNLCDSKNLLRACNSCNTWVENNDAEARKKGFVKSKFKTT